MDPVSLIVLAGGGLYATKVLKDKDDAPAGTNRPPVAKVKTARFPEPTMNPTSVKATSPGTMYPYQVSTSKARDATASSPHPKEIEDKVMAKAKAEYDKLSVSAKQKACASLKAQYPNDKNIQALPCPGNFQQILKACAFAAGTGACVASGVGAAVSPLCGIAAGWIAGWAGPKLEEWSKDAYNETKDAVAGAAKKVGSTAKKAAKKAGKKAKSVAKSLIPGW